MVAGGLYLDTMFDVRLESGGFESGVRWVIKTRHGIYWHYRLDGPPGPMLGKIVFRQDTPAVVADGSYVIGEFRPDHGKPLPISVRLERTRSEARPPVADSTFGPVIERVLPFDRSFIDFQSGSVLRPDLEKLDASGADWEPWLQQTGADAMVEEASEQRIVQPPPSDHSFPRLVALSSDLPERRGDRESCVFVSEETDDFDSARPNDADARLKIVTERDLYWGIANGSRPWWFKTRDGAKGVLQILGTSDTPRGLKLHYKLVQDHVAKTP